MIMMFIWKKCFFKVKDKSADCKRTPSSLRSSRSRVVLSFFNKKCVILNILCQRLRFRFSSLFFCLYLFLSSFIFYSNETKQIFLNTNTNNNHTQFIFRYKIMKERVYLFQKFVFCFVLFSVMRSKGTRTDISTNLQIIKNAWFGFLWITLV